MLDQHLSYLEGRCERPTLDHLGPHDREVATDLMRLMETGRGIDPYAETPSLRSLLAGTEFEDQP